ncbi:hypothetical protein J2T18_001974 [Paenibacillus polymyxa]|nr:hypothetical protein [Paenibacillus polymyxa]
MSYGIPKGMYQGYMERAAKQNDSWNDMLNFGTFGVRAIAENSGMKESRVQRIKEHAFINEHIKSSGYSRFHSDYEIAQAWDRLQKGL